MKPVLLIQITSVIDINAFSGRHGSSVLAERAI